MGRLGLAYAAVLEGYLLPWPPVQVAGSVLTAPVVVLILYLGVFG